MKKSKLIICIVCFTMIGLFNIQCNGNKQSGDSEGSESVRSEQREEARHISLSREDAEEQGFDAGVNVATNNMDRLLQDLIQMRSMDDIKSKLTAEGETNFKEKYGRPSTNDEQELMRIYSEQYYMGVIGVIGTGLTLLNAK